MSPARFPAVAVLSLLWPALFIYLHLTCWPQYQLNYFPLPPLPPAPHLLAPVRVILHLNVAELKGKRLDIRQVPGRRQLTHCNWMRVWVDSGFKAASRQ